MKSFYFQYVLEAPFTKSWSLSQEFRPLIRTKMTTFINVWNFIIFSSLLSKSRWLNALLIFKLCPLLLNCEIHRSWSKGLRLFFIWGGWVNLWPYTKHGFMVIWYMYIRITYCRWSCVVHSQYNNFNLVLKTSWHFVPWPLKMCSYLKKSILFNVLCIVCFWK